MKNHPRRTNRARTRTCTSNGPRNPFRQPLQLHQLEVEEQRVVFSLEVAHNVPRDADVVVALLAGRVVRYLDVRLRGVRQDDGLLVPGGVVGIPEVLRGDERGAVLVVALHAPEDVPLDLRAPERVREGLPRPGQPGVELGAVRVVARRLILLGRRLALALALAFSVSSTYLGCHFGAVQTLLFYSCEEFTSDY